MKNKTLIDKLESFNEQLNLTHYWIILLKYTTYRNTKIILIRHDYIPCFFTKSRNISQIKKP